MTEVLKNRYRMLPGRCAAFLDVQRGLFVHVNGVELDYGEPMSLADLLNLVDSVEWARERPQMIYLIGGWNAASTPVRDWFVAPDGWERVGYHRNPLIANYKRGKIRVTIYGSAQWFGSCADVNLVRQAYVRLRILLKGNFGNEVELMGTPARTGLDLLERTLPLNKEKVAYEWPVLSLEVRQVIESNIGQGRMEMLRQSEKTPKAEKLYIMDAIWMYASCCRRLCSGPVQHDVIDQYIPYRVGFYRVEFQVPVGWQHIGLLPAWNPKERRSVWPSKPSTFWYTAYVCAEELALALDYGWPLRIKERWLFEEGDSLAQDPLRNWISKLRDLRAACTDEREGADLARLLRGAVRAICIKAIGSLHRKGRYQVIETHIDRIDEIPADAEIVFRAESYVRWRRPIPLDPSMAHFAHPEWSAYIWGRARAKLARAALQLPREALIGLRSDAIAVTYDPGWQGEKPGEFRLKRVIDLVGRPLPRTTAEYLEVLQESEDEE